MNLAGNGRLQILLAAILGGIAGFGQAPYGLPIVLLAGFTAVLFLYPLRLTPVRAGLFGWAFGTGYFMHVLQWLISPFMVDAARHGWMAPFALILLAGFMASYWGLAFMAARALSRRSAWPLILCFPLAEMARAYAFTGFAWGMPAQAFVDTLAGQSMAWAGPYALSTAVMALAVALSVPGRLLWKARAGQGAVIATALAGTFLPATFSEPVIAPDRPIVRLVQPNIAQRDKWQPDLVEVHFRRQIDFTATPGAGGRAPDLVIWSETAIPWSLENAQTALDQIALAGGSATVMLGLQRSEDNRFYNSSAVLGPDGTPEQIYDKHHLVPYGEYMPFGDLLAKVGIYGLAAGEGFGYSKGGGPKMLDFGEIGQALPLICYEAVFPHDVGAAPERPDFLIQITNDAWFGKGAGPLQHLAQARMRAIEQGLPLARAANTGVSAMIDPRGRVIELLPLNEAGFLDVPLPEPLPPTLYSRTGDLPLALLAALLVAAAGVQRFRSRRS